MVTVSQNGCTQKFCQRLIELNPDLSTLQSFNIILDLWQMKKIDSNELCTLLAFRMNSEKRRVAIAWIACIYFPGNYNDQT